METLIKHEVRETSKLALIKLDQAKTEAAAGPLIAAPNTCIGLCFAPVDPLPTRMLSFSVLAQLLDC